MKQPSDESPDNSFTLRASSQPLLPTPPAAPLKDNFSSARHSTLAAYLQKTDNNPEERWMQPTPQRARNDGQGREGVYTKAPRYSDGYEKGVAFHGRYRKVGKQEEQLDLVEEAVLKNGVADV